MADGLGRAPGVGFGNDSDPTRSPGPSPPLSSPRSEHMRSSSQLLPSRMPDLVRDSKLETHFLPDSSVETVHTYHEPDYKSRRRLVTRSEHWRRYGKIGGGSFGSVWLEKCTKGARRENGLRAIKQMEVRRQSTRVDYNRELEAIAKFSHWKYERAFVKSFGWYESPEHLFIAMEYLELGDLHMYLHHKPALPESEAKEVTFQILDGLSMMHDNEFAHRDMKPKNILLKSCPPDEWWVKIADFGISKRIEDEVGGSSTLKGTLGYIAPELHGFIQRGTPYAPDLWAVGEIAFQMLTKQSTFKNLGVLFKYIHNPDLFPYDLLHTGRVSQSGQECLLSLLRPDPIQRATAEVALQHTWFNEAPLSRNGSVRSARNASPPVPVAEPGTEEFATWNTIATQESDITSFKPINESHVGTLNSEADQGRSTSLDPQQPAGFRVGTSSAPSTGDVGPARDIGRTESISSDQFTDLIGELSIRSRSVAEQPGGAQDPRLANYVVPQSPSVEGEQIGEINMPQEQSTGRSGISSDADHLTVQVDGAATEAQRLRESYQAWTSDVPREQSVDRPDGRAVNDTGYTQGYPLGAGNTLTDWHKPQTATLAHPEPRRGSLDVHTGNPEPPETFIAQRMREIWDSRGNDLETYESQRVRLGNRTPWEPGITSTNERPDWQPPQSTATKQAPDSKSKINKTFKELFSRRRSKHDSGIHTAPPVVADIRPLRPTESWRRIFGTTIDDLYARHPNMPLPLVVSQCIASVETFGLDLEGIYRQSEKPDTIQRMIAEHEFFWPDQDLKLPANFYHNIHNVANLLKRFFRDLPVPLFGFEHYSNFIDAARFEDDIRRRDTIHAIINQLSDPVYVTLRAMTLHLHKVQQHSNRNRMTTGNLAIIFGPTLMGSSPQQLVDTGWQVRTVETVITYALDIFDED